jgi:predicted O-methyltransferase YrrM
MDEQRRRLADEVYAKSHAYDQTRQDRLERFRNLEPPTAELLGVLIRAAGAKRILELGTSNGYSTLWLGDGAEATGGRVLSIDNDAGRTELARANVEAAELAAIVGLRTEDAADTLRTSPDVSWDLIFLDAERPFYAAYLPDLLRVLAPGGVLAVDNVISHEHELTEFTALIEAETAFTQTVVAIGAGLRLAVKARS